MKGIVLAGGLGSRLFPLTKVTNKHLLPIYNKPMIYYPLEKLVQAGVRDVMLVTGGNSSGDFMRLLGSGREIGLKSLSYAYQEGEGGIAHALSLAERFAGTDRVAVILGDNLFEDNLRGACERFQKQPRGARIILKRVPDAQRFGVVDISKGKIKNIVEKPKKPKSNLAVTGFYLYDSQVFQIIKNLKPSGRGELEITDVNAEYLRRDCLEYDIIKKAWTDAGTFQSLLRANLFASKISDRS